MLPEQAVHVSHNENKELVKRMKVGKTQDVQSYMSMFE